VQQIVFEAGGSSTGFTLAYANGNQLLLQACINNELSTAVYYIPPGWIDVNTSGYHHVVVAWVDNVAMLRVVR
jgi:hypothetical protein